MHTYSADVNLADDTLASIDDKDIQEIENSIASLEWSDIVDLYDPKELDYRDFPVSDDALPDEYDDALDNKLDHHMIDDHPELHQEALEESLNAQQRMQRRLIFARSKQRRRIAMKIALHRVSGPGKLKKRSQAMAKRLLTKKLLSGRSKSQLSPQEKARLEVRLSSAAPLIARIAQKVLPQIRNLEQSRLRAKQPKNNLVDRIRKMIGK